MPTLKSLHVKNFRAIDDIRIEFDNLVNVIVGPNAIGKTTLLETIRLIKAALASRTAGELTQVLLQLGIVSPHNTQVLIADAVVRDEKLPIEIACHYELSPGEIQTIGASLPRIATDLVLSQIGQTFGVPGAMTAFLSSEPGK